MRLPDTPLPYLLLLLVFSAAGLVLADDDDGDDGPRSARALPQVSHPQWKQECSSCHMLYPPALLPERSWRAMMGGLDAHFGENAQLDAATRDNITAFLVANSADHTAARRARMLARSIPADEIPLRISTTRYFRRKHDEVSTEVFKRASVGSAANCVACHSGAEKGAFSEETVRIPR